VNTAALLSVASIAHIVQLAFLSRRVCFRCRASCRWVHQPDDQCRSASREHWLAGIMMIMIMIMILLFI